VSDALDRVYIDRRAGGRSRSDQKLAIDVLIIQRDRVERVRELARAWGLGVARVGMSSAARGIVGNFLETPATLSRLQFTTTDCRLSVVAVTLAPCVSV